MDYFEVNRAVGREEWVHFCGHPVPSTITRVCDTLKELGFTPQSFADAGNALFNKYEITVPDGYPKDVVRHLEGRGPVAVSPMNEFAACVGQCVQLDTKHGIDVSRILRRELMGQNSRRGIVHADSASAVALYYADNGASVTVLPERAEQRNPDLLIDDNACEVKTVLESDWWGDVDPTTGLGSEHNLTEDLCYDIGTFIAKRDSGHKGIKQADIVFADLSRKSPGLIRSMLGTAPNGLPDLMRNRLVFFSRQVMSFLNHYVDFDPALWKLIREVDKTHQFGVWPPPRPPEDAG